jgi:hypothetical protein
MHRDNGGGGGPFAYYPTSGDAIRETADDIGTRAGDIGVVRRQVEDAHRLALAGIDGDLAVPMANAPVVTMATADRVEQAAWFAAGVIRMFADAVDDYNHYATGPRSIEALNTAYLQARLDDFGLEASTYAKSGPKADGDYDADRAAASAELLGSLSAEYHRLEAWLDLRADQVARMLDRGPNPGDVTVLWAAGALPPDATAVWPNLDLAEVPLMRMPYELRDDPDDRRTLRGLTQDELMELWEEYGFEPARELLADQVVHDFENMIALRELNLSINLAYMTAMSQGMPEWAARRLARAHPVTLFDLLAPVAKAGEVTYDLTIGDLVDAIEDDPWSLRTLGELAMVTPIGKLGKIRDLQRALDELRDAERATDAAGDTRRVVKINGPKDFDPNCLRGARPDDVRASIPDNWSMRRSRSGDGEVYNDPLHRGRQIRIMPGYPAGSRPDPLTTGPYAVVSQNGAPPVKIPLAGNPTLGAR